MSDIGAQPLEGLRIVDLGGMATAYGSRMMAACGAEVIKVEPPTGNQLRRLGPFVEGGDEGEASLWWAYLAMGTQSVVIDIDDAAGRGRLSELLCTADIVLDDHGPDVLDDLGLGYTAISAANPGVIWISITPFGISGPKRSWKSSNLVAWASSGVLFTVGFDDQPPVVPGGPAQLAMHAASINAAIGSVFGLRSRRKTGRGQLIDISLQEACLAISPETGVSVFLDDRVNRVRSGNRRTLSRPFGLYPCSDGYVSILIVMPDHWVSMAEWIHEVCDNDAVTDPVFADMAVRGQTMELIDDWTEELTTQLPMIEVFQEGQRRGIPITPVNTIEALRTDPHLEAAGYWQETELSTGALVAIPGSPFRTNAGWWLTARAPRLGEHTDKILS